jgi:hypothetical protein
MSEDRDVERPGLNERIKEAAYFLWLSEGKPHGRDQDHWSRAEAAVLSDGKEPATIAPPIPETSRKAKRSK